MKKRKPILRSDCNGLMKDAVPVESMRNQPNSETKEAINEARSGKTAGQLDMSSFDSFMDSVNKF